MIATHGITTTTHNIAADYTINETYQWMPLDIDGDSFDEIVADMLKFWNEHPETVEPFTAEDPDTVEGAIVVALCGRVFAYDPEGFLSDTETDEIVVVVSAEPRE